MTFARKPRPERPRPPVTPLTRPVVIADPSKPTAPQLKREYVRSKALREAFRRIPCQHCNADDGTVCCAHSNWAEHGKGKSVKADDNRAASLCFACHSWLDQGAADGAAKRAMWDAAHAKSVRLLVQRGLWPDGIPVPDV